MRVSLRHLCRCVLPRHAAAVRLRRPDTDVVLLNAHALSQVTASATATVTSAALLAATTPSARTLAPCAVVRPAGVCASGVGAPADLHGSRGLLALHAGDGTCHGSNNICGAACGDDSQCGWGCAVCRCVRVGLPGGRGGA